MKNKISELFQMVNLGKVRSIEKIGIGFTNDIFLINKKYILKIFPKNNKNFQKEVYFYNLFKNKIPVPNIIYSSNSKKFFKKPFMIYKMLPGDNLYARWNSFYS